jgi:hypothetical protein
MNSDIRAGLSIPGQARIWALEQLAYEPTGDPEVANALEAILDDRSPCRMEVHYIGETRLLAAIALVAERGGPVHIRTAGPIRAGDLITILENADLPWPQVADENSDSALVAFDVARRNGLLPEREFELALPIDVAAIALPSRSAPEEPKQMLESPTSPSIAATEDDISAYLGWLTHGSLDDRVFALQELIRRPTGNPKIREALDPLLNDLSPCVFQIPYRFGELRYLAARALAAERSFAGDRRKVRLRCAAPLTVDELARAAGIAQISGAHSGNAIENQLGLFAELRAGGLLPEMDLEFVPQ